MLGAANTITPPAGGGFPAIPALDLILYAGSSWQTEINNAGVGANIGFASGVYNGFNVTLLANQKLWPATENASIVFNGNGTSRAMYGSKLNGVQMDFRRAGVPSGFTPHPDGDLCGAAHFTNYQGSFYLGIISNLLSGDWYADGLNTAGWVANGWKVRGIYMTNVGTHCVTLCGDDAELTDFHFTGHPSGRRMEIGYKMLYGHDQIVKYGRNHQARPTNWENEGGGCKNWGTHRLLQEDIISYDHVGPAFWNDNRNFNSTWRRLEAYSCTGAGIFDEINVNAFGPEPSGENLIEYCNIHDGIGTDPPPFGIWQRSGPGIHIVNSGFTRVRYNTVTNCPVGIGFLDQIRIDQAGETCTNQSAGRVEFNTLDDATVSGAQRDHTVGGSPYSNLTSVTWASNTYINGSTGP